MKRKGRTVITVDYRIDGCMAREEWITKGRHNVKVHPDGRGYIRIDGIHALYAGVERIVVQDGRRA